MAQVDLCMIDHMLIACLSRASCGRRAGRHQLERIREQFEAQDAENKRKLERLNG